MNVHRTDKLSLVFGLIFVSFVVAWLFGSQLDVDLPTAGWFIAGGLILFGALGLMGSLRPRNRSESVSTPPAPAPEDW
jgi:hypothetical protein